VRAHRRGEVAEFHAYEDGVSPDTPDLNIYRTNADRSIEVFRPNLGRPSDGPWRTDRCTGLRPTAGGFELTCCGAEVAP
jgi:hypothetical protein